MFFEQMFKDYREPFSFTDEHRRWATQLLETRTRRMTNWSRTKYLAVLTDLYTRIRGNPSEGRAWAVNVKDAPLVDLDTMVVNCSALAIVAGSLQPSPPKTPQ